MHRGDALLGVESNIQVGLEGWVHVWEVNGSTTSRKALDAYSDLVVTW